MTQVNTDAVRIDKEILNKVRQIAKKNGQTISGYLNTRLSKVVEKDWAKFDKNSKLA